MSNSFSSLFSPSKIIKLHSKIIFCFQNLFWFIFLFNWRFLKSSVCDSVVSVWKNLVWFLIKNYIDTFISWLKINTTGWRGFCWNLYWNIVCSSSFCIPKSSSCWFIFHLNFKIRSHFSRFSNNFYCFSSKFKVIIF